MEEVLAVVYRVLATGGLIAFIVIAAGIMLPHDDSDDEQPL